MPSGSDTHLLVYRASSADVEPPSEQDVEKLRRVLAQRDQLMALSPQQLREQLGTSVSASVPDLGAGLKQSERALLWFLQGRAMDIESPEAEHCLARSLKLDPGNTDAWNCAGDLYWQQGDVNMAKQCFHAALARRRNPTSLRSLSMVLRQVAPGSSEWHTAVQESVKLAREAVQLDVKDGQSWYVLGNAHLSMFFVSNEAIELNRSLMAYQQAERSGRVLHQQDLHYNRATVYRFLELYQEALADFEIAAKLDAAWREPREQIDSIVKFVRQLADLLDTSRGERRVRGRRLTTLVASLPHKAVWNDRLRVAIGALDPGENPGRAIVGKVIGFGLSESRVPLCIALVDRTQATICVSVYGLDASIVKLSDTMVVLDPHLKQITVDHAGAQSSYPTLFVSHPGLLIVNGRVCPARAVVRSVLRVQHLGE